MVAIATIDMAATPGAANVEEAVCLRFARVELDQPFDFARFRPDLSMWSLEVREQRD